MGNIHWNDLSGKKRWRKAKNNKKDELFLIAQKYHLTKDTYPQFMGSDEPYFTFESFEYDAINYADNKYSHTMYVRGGFNAIVMPILQVIATILIAVASFALFVSTAGLSAPLSAYLIAGGIGAITSITTTSISTSYQQNTLKENIKQAQNKWQESAQDFKKQAQERSAELTSLMVYNKYDIYATNTIYNQGQAGSSLDTNTYNPSFAYDPTRGLRGDMGQKDVEFDKSITYKNHTHLGGNKDFYQVTIGADFPIKSQGFDYAIDSELTQKGMDRRLSEINEGFGALIDAGAGITGIKHSAVEKTSNPSKAYAEITQYEMGFFKNKLSLNDSLYKQERYKKGLWADFSYIRFYDIAQQRESAMKTQIELINNWDSDESQKYRDSLSEKELCKVVFEQMILNLECTIDLLDDEDIKKRIILQPYNYINGLDNAMGVADKYIRHNTREIGEALFSKILHINDITTLSDLEERFYRFKYCFSDYHSKNVYFENNISNNFEFLALYAVKNKRDSKDKLDVILPQIPTQYHSQIETLHYEIIKDSDGQYFSEFAMFGWANGYYIYLDSTSDAEREFLIAMTKRLWDNRLDSIDYKAYTLADLG